MKAYLIPRKISLFVLSGLIILSFFHHTSTLNPWKIINSMEIACPFRFITGIPCPGCGMTHSFISITQGNLWDAACFNPFSYFLIFLLCISIFPDAYIQKQTPRAIMLMKSFFVFVLCSTLLYWLLFKVFKLL